MSRKYGDLYRFVVKLLAEIRNPSAVRMSGRDLRAFLASHKASTFNTANNEGKWILRVARMVDSDSFGAL